MISQHYDELPSEMDIPILERGQDNSPQGREYAGTIRGNRHTVVPTPGIHVVGYPEVLFLVVQAQGARGMRTI